MIKDIIGYEGFYTIDEYGNVYDKNGNPLHPYITNKGYKAIDLHKNGVRKKYLIHRLVAIHFIPNPNNYPIVLHKDNVKLNTHYTNLKWGTYSENNSQAIKDGLNTIPKPDNRKFYKLYNDTNFIVCHGSKEIIKLIDGTESIVRNSIFRKTPISSGTYKGYYIERTELIKPFTIEI